LNDSASETRQRVRIGDAIGLPAGAFYCDACRIVLPDGALGRHDPRRHPIVAAVFCGDCRANGAAEMACVKWERNVYRQEVRATRAKLRRVERQLGTVPGPAVAAA
jgi:hypothetical protein